MNCLGHRQSFGMALWKSGHQPAVLVLSQGVQEKAHELCRAGFWDAQRWALERIPRNAKFGEKRMVLFRKE
jgi:hypothetical protein